MLQTIAARSSDPLLAYGTDEDAWFGIDPETIQLERRGRIAIITMNRPEAMNAYTREMLAGLDQAFRIFDRDPELWVAILTGAGAKSFSAGMDLKDAAPQCTLMCWTLGISTIALSLAGWRSARSGIRL